MRLKTLLGTVWLVAVTCGAQPIETQIERARQLDRQPGFQEGGAQSLTGTDAVAPVTAGSTDDLGAQVILKRQEKWKAFDAFADVSGLFTNNVALTRNDRHEDWMGVANFGLSNRQRLTDSISSEVTVRGGLLRYQDFSQLDFNSIDAGGGLSWLPPHFWDINLFGRYNYTALFSTDGDNFFQNHTLTFGAQRAFILGRAHSITIGYSSVLGFADPRPAERDEHGVFAGYHVNLTRRLELDLSYRASLYVYSGDGNRHDINQTASLGVRYNFTPWAAATVFGSFVANNSNRNTFDYTAVTSGVGAAVSIKF